jgi:hypothetical protein
VSVDEWVGDEFPPQRASGSTRVYFVNANGIWYGAMGGEMNKVCARVLEGNINIIGIAEMKLDTKIPCVVHMCRTLQLSRGSITGRVIASGTDNMGRWCGRCIMAVQIDD